MRQKGVDGTIAFICRLTRHDALNYDECTEALPFDRSEKEPNAKAKLDAAL